MTLIGLLQSSPAVLIAVCVLFGLIIGSFLNVVIYRLPVMLEREWRAQCREFLDPGKPNEESPEEAFNLIVPRSRCPACAKPITAFQNIPILSYLAMRGRCACREQRISPRYPLVELAGGILAGIVAWHFGFSWQTLFAVLLTWALIALTVIDFDTQLLPDAITLPFLWLGLLCNAAGLFTDIYSAVFGAAAGYLSLWLVYQLFRLFTGKEGMGFGDFKLLALLGAWMGWQMLPLIIILSSVVGALVGLSLMIFRAHQRDVPIPFGPYLATAGWIGLLWGGEITQSYLQWTSPI